MSVLELNLSSIKNTEQANSEETPLKYSEKPSTLTCAKVFPFFLTDEKKSTLI